MEKYMFTCEVCEREYQHGPQIYNGRYIERYKLWACESCYGGNWDGWNPHYEEKIITHLKNKGLTIPKRNDKGWLPRE